MFFGDITYLLSIDSYKVAGYKNYPIEHIKQATHDWEKYIQWKTLFLSHTKKSKKKKFGLEKIGEKFLWKMSWISGKWLSLFKIGKHFPNWTFSHFFNDSQMTKDIFAEFSFRRIFLGIFVFRESNF